MKELSTGVVKKTMTVKEVAEVLGYNARWIQLKCAELGFTQNGKKTLLTEEQVTELKKHLVPRTLQVKLQGENAVTELEMMQNIQRGMMWLTQKANILQKQLEEAKPKVEFYDSVMQSADTCDMGTVAKVLNCGIGRTKLFEFLRKKGVLMSDNRPYQKFVDAGMFRVVESKWATPDGDIHVNYKTVVFQKGLDFIKKIVEKGE